MSGWIKLHRKFTDWEWYEDDKCLRLFIHLLLKVNHKDKKWRGEIVERGSVITSLSNLSGEVNMSIQSLRTTIKHLESTGDIAKKSTNKLTKLIVCNYNSYQDEQQATNNQANKQLTSNQQATNSKQECKNKENEKKVIYSAFYDSQISETTNQNYIRFVKYLFGDNMLNSKLSGILSIKNQLTVEEFEKIMSKCEANKKKVGDILTMIENDSKYYKGKKSLYRTLLNWSEDRFTK